MKTTLLQHVQESASLRHAFFQAEIERIVAQGEDMAERLKRAYAPGGERAFDALVDYMRKGLAVDAAALDAQMLGVNCTPPRFMTAAIKNLQTGTRLPLAVYPNSGEVYDAVSKTWHGATDSSKTFGEYARDWFQAGAAAVGGCCQTAASHIAQVTKVRDQLQEEK